MAEHGHGHFGRNFGQLLVGQSGRADRIVVGHQQEQAKLLDDGRSVVAGHGRRSGGQTLADSKVHVPQGGPQLVGVGPVLVGRAATCIQIQTDPLVDVEVGGIERRAVLAVEVKGCLRLPFLDC